jgi:hypothetical protein
VTPAQLLQSAALLGLFVLLAGAYGLLYSLGHVRGRQQLVIAARISYAAQCATTLAILWLTPLTFGWKAFVALSCLAYLAIPPLTLRFLRLTHNFPEHRT